MKSLLLCVLCALTLDAQSLSITKPGSGDALTGYSGYNFQVSLSSAAAAVKVCYTLDSYPAFNPGIDGATTLGCSITPPFSYPYNSFWNLNGAHQVIATAYNALGVAVATSAAVPFTIANTWPISYGPAMTVATGTPLSSNWAGAVSVTPTIAGAGSGDSKVFYWYIDGILQGTNSTTATNATLAVVTTQFPDGPHDVCVESTDTTNPAVYSDLTVNAATEWCRTVTFANGATPFQARTSAHDIYLAPTATYTLSAQVLRTDGTTAASSPVFLSSNTSVATVGQTTGVVTGVAKGNANITAMTPTITATDLATGGSNARLVTSASHPFNYSMTGWLLRITGGSGWTPGLYTITNVSNITATLSVAPAGTSATGGQFSTGPTRQDWVFVWPANTMPCIGSNGAPYSSYSPSCFVMHSIFQGNNLLTSDAPYNPGAAADIAAGGLNTFEFSAPYTGITGTESPSGMSAWQTAQNTYTASSEGRISAFPNLGVYLIGDNFTRSGTKLWGTTNGPAGQWTTPALQLAVGSWNAYGNARGMNGQDEVQSSWNANPLQGPVSFGATSQSWLNSITASSGTCTASTTGTILNAAWQFVIHGSAIGGMNNAYPSNYAASTGVGNSFTFACPGVANGTYNSVNDPGLVLEPYAAGVISGSWGSIDPATGFITSNAFARIRNQFVASGVTFGLAWANSGLAGCASIANWNGNGTQSNSGVTQIADESVIYAPNSPAPYLTSRYSMNGVLTIGNIGGTLRSEYGCFSPTLPMIALTDATQTGGYGIGYGPQVAVASASGNTITFSAPHGIANIIPGMSRLFITGATNTGSPQDSTNNNFFIQSVPDATHVTVSLAAADFMGGSGAYNNGGTANFQDGSTTALAGIFASGGANCGGTFGSTNGLLCGDFLEYSGGGTTTMARKRGQTFNVTGVTGTNGGLFATNNFVLTPENLNLASPIPFLKFRQIPVLSATGGTATIILDSNDVKGRNPSQDGVGTTGDYSIAYQFANTIECIFLRCAGERIYNSNPAMSAYSDQFGFSNGTASSVAFHFAETGTNQNTLQLYMNQHYENSTIVPLYHAHSIAALYWNRYGKYWFQPRLNSPDYGPYIDCGAAGGAPGDIMACMNVSDGPETVTFNLSPYLQSGQQIIQQVVNDHSLGAFTALNAGTTTATVALQPGDVASFAFPAVFVQELNQPTITARLADVATATKIVLRYGYDPYYLDTAGNTYDCGTGTCTPPWDRNAGTVYYRLIYLGSGSQVLATSDVQRF